MAKRYIARYCIGGKINNVVDATGSTIIFPDHYTAKEAGHAETKNLPYSWSDVLEFDDLEDVS